MKYLILLFFVILFVLVIWLIKILIIPFIIIGFIFYLINKMTRKSKNNSYYSHNTEYSKQQKDSNVIDAEYREKYEE